MTTSTVLIQLLVLAVVLESDLGRRKVGWFRVWRPVVTVVAVVPFFLTGLPTGGGDSVLQGAAALAGVVLGAASVTPALVGVAYDPVWRPRWPRTARTRPGAVVSHSGWGYAVVWVAVTAARLAFSYGSEHIFPVSLGRFMAEHQLSPAGLANAFIFSALGMSLARSLVLAVRGRAARGLAPAY
jgi:hypothetical protein